MSRRVVVIGGTGAFGGRLVEGLLATSDLPVVIAARRRQPAEEAVAALRARYPGRMIEACVLDANVITADDLRRLDAWCVVDAAGLFQGAPPRVAEAAVAARCHYVDLADARAFVAAFPRLDGAARAAGVLAVAGASTTPGLGQAVLDTLVRGWQRLDRVEIAISPGNRQPRGLSVVKAILAGAGQPVRVFRDGRWTDLRGMSLLMRRRMPGLGRRWLFLIDTPDLDLVPLRFKPRRDALWYAGLELTVLHLGVWALSRLVAAGLLRSLVPLARPMRVVADWFRSAGTGRGGMMVAAQGIDRDGRAVVATWALIAGEADGPHVPVLPALAVVRALAEGRLARTGAMACAGLIPLSDFARDFAHLHIVTRTRMRPQALIARVVGASFERMPAPVRAAHLVDERLRLAGRASVGGAASPLGRLLARLIGFPPAAADVPVSVEMRVERDGETWTRDFGGCTFRSRLAPGGRPGRATERFGALTFDLVLAAGPDGLDLTITGGRLGPLPLPRLLLPRSAATERVDGDGRFRFDVPISLPGVGQLVHYRGWLVPESRMG
jgi:saccharopine dehydrogenase-like NADP-dependent oxidoreductase